MKRFKFSLESVLTVRQKALEDERIRLASIMNIYNKQQDVLDEMNFKLNQLRMESEKYLEYGEFNPNLIVSYNAFAHKLIQDIKTQEKIMEKTKLELEHQQEIAKEAYIQVKSLENLKEKQKQQYNQELLQEEFKMVDDIVNSRRTIA